MTTPVELKPIALKYRGPGSESMLRNLGSMLPVELTALEPEARVVNWKDKRYLRRECLREINPEVAALMRSVRNVGIDGTRAMLDRVVGAFFNLSIEEASRSAL